MFGLASVAETRYIPYRYIAFTPHLHGLSTENAPGDDLFFIRDYPHLQLFPKLDAVIHHGGAGNTGQSINPQKSLGRIVEAILSERQAEGMSPIG
jgi:UDP:flavonoid glycosyltransferase YjiC (YdhE family)